MWFFASTRDKHYTLALIYRPVDPTSVKKGLRQLAGAALLIIAIGLPSCAAFNQALAHPATSVESD